MAKTEKTGFSLTGGAASEGVVLNVSFAFPDKSSALKFEEGLEAPAAGKKAKAEKEAPAKGGRRSAKKDEEEDEDEDDEESDDEDEEDEDSEDDEDEDEDDEDEKPAKGKKSSKKDDSEPVKIRVTKELKAATRLRDVIEQLMGQGLKGAQLVNACKKLQDTLPVLKAIKDLETRVPRAASLVNSKK